MIHVVGRAALLALMLCCQGCAAGGGAVLGAGALALYNTLTEVETVATDLNDGLELGEDLICGVWGAVWKRPTPDTVSGLAEDVAIFCSGDPAVGSTPLATLSDLWGKVLAIRKAQKQARA